MLEAIILLIIVFFLPYFDLSPLWAILIFLFVLPGIYATSKGAPFIPTSSKLVRRMIELAKIQPGEHVYDLGCGDGRFIFAAARAGANAIGYEYSIPTFLLAKLRSLTHPHAQIRYADFWAQDYRSADVIFCYLLKDTMQTFKQKIWPQLKPGTRVVSHSFRMEGIDPEYQEKDVVVYRK